MKTKTAIWVDFDGDKTGKYNPKAICRHGWLKIQAIKSRTEGIPFRLNYFSRDTVNCYLSSTLIFLKFFLFFHTLIIWKFIYHVDFLKFFHVLIFLISFFTRWFLWIFLIFHMLIFWQKSNIKIKISTIDFFENKSGPNWVV